MASITKFEDLIAWQEARTLVKMVYKTTSDGAFTRDFGMRDQIQRASVSVMANIAEGFDCESTAEFARFFWGLRAAQLLKFSLCFMQHLMLNILNRMFLNLIMSKPKSVKP